MEMVAGDPNESHIRQPVEITSKPEVLENIHCSESLVPDSQDHNKTEDADGAGDCGSTLQEVNSGTKVEGETKPGKDDDLAASDQVSSTTESFSSETDQQNSHGLPSINHQSVVVPNMEPYLEEGSLDGVKEEMHPPDVSSTESESNNDKSNVDSTSSQNLTNEVPTSMEESVVDTCKQEQATEEEITGQEMQLPDDEPTSIKLDNPQGVPEESVTSEVDLVRSDNEAIIDERDEQATVPADCRMEAEETTAVKEEVSMEQSTQPEHMDSSKVPLEEPISVQPITDAEVVDIPQENLHKNVVLDKSSALDSNTEPSQLMLDQQYIEQAQYIDTAPPEQITNQPMQPLEQAESEPGQEQVPEQQNVEQETNQMVEHSTEPNPEQLSAETMEQAEVQQIEHQIPVEIMEQGVTNQLLEHEPEHHMQDHQMHNHLLEQQTPEQQVANQQILEQQILQQHALEHQISEEQMLQHEALEQHIMQQQMPVQLPNQIMEHISNQQVPMGHEMIPDQSLMSAQPTITDGTISNQAVLTDHQTGTVQIQGQSMILEQQIQVQEQEEMENTAAACEADTSVSYSGHQLAQSVYVVDESGGLTLNSINRDGSMATYHNSEGASAGHMLVEMAPMSTDGSYVNTHTQVRYVDAASLSCDGGQEGGMISDAQAAELLMRVSEQRPTLSLQGDPSCSTVPYVQVQLAQTVEGITHLVEVPVSALGYLPSTLVYTTPVNSGAGSGGNEMSTWVVEAPPGVDQQQSQQVHHSHHQTHSVENKFSDIVSASIEAIGFPESAAPGTTILSQAEQILIASDGSGHHHHHHVDPSSSSASTAAASVNFDFDDSSSNSSLTLMNCETKTHGTGTYPRPKRESIESRINRLLRGANAPPGPDPVNEDWMPPTKSAGTPVKTLKLAPVQSTATISGKLSSGSSSPATVTLNLNDSGPAQPPKPRISVARPTLSHSGATVSIPTIYTSTTVKPVTSSSNTLPPLPPGHTDYLMPRGVSKRKAQTQKVTKVNPLNPNCIDADPAPPEETQVKLVMSADTNTEQVDVNEDENKDDDDEYNRLVLLQARQRQQTERVTDTSRFRIGRNRQVTYLNSSLQEVTVSAPAPIRRISETDASDTLLSLSVEKKVDTSTAPKRARLSFPPEKYADLDVSTYSSVTSYMTELQTPKLTYSSPRTRQIRTNNRAVKDGVSVDQSTVGIEPKDVSVQPLANPAEEREKRLPRIIRQYGNSVETSKTRLAAESRDTSALDEDEEEEIDSAEQVIVIGLDETGKQPSEEQLTAIIQAAMTKQEKHSVTATKEGAAPPRPAKPVVAHIASPPAGKPPPLAPVKRKAAEEDNGVDNEEHPVQVKVIRTYDRNHGLTRRKPRTKPRPFLDIFDFKQDEEEEEEEGEEEEVDELEPFSQALVDEENQLREQEIQRQQTTTATSPVVSARKETSASITSAAPHSRRGGGRGKGRNSTGTRAVRGKAKGRSRGGKRSQSADASSRTSNQKEPVTSGAKSAAKSSRSPATRRRSSVDGSPEDDAYDLTYVDDVKDDDYKPSRGRGRGRSRGRSRSRGRRTVERRSSSKAEEEEEEAAEEEDERDENDFVEAAPEEEADEMEADEEDDDDEMKIPGLPTKPCPQCQERFTTQEGFLEHVTSHTSAKCLVCNWKNPSGEKKPLLQHMLNSHRTAIPTARSNSR